MVMIFFGMDFIQKSPFHRVKMWLEFSTKLILYEMDFVWNESTLSSQGMLRQETYPGDLLQPIRSWREKRRSHR